MVTKESWRQLLLCLLIGQGCAADGDAVSRELVAVSQLVVEPIGQLLVSDDGLYEFMDSTTMTVRRGELSTKELDALRSHTTGSALDVLYAEREDDDDRCQQDIGSYVVGSRMGTVCFVLLDISNPEARARLEFLIELYERRASE